MLITGAKRVGATLASALAERGADVALSYNQSEREANDAAATVRALGLVPLDQIDVFGGIGYTKAHRIERLYRDARLNWLEEGTPTIQQLVIARQVIDGYRS